jgi:hypothetical protein
MGLLCLLKKFTILSGSIPKHRRTNVIQFFFLLEIYLQYLENTKLFNIIIKLHIVLYFRHVNDIVAVYHGSTTNIHEVSNASNGMTPCMKFAMQEDTENIFFFRYGH